MGFSQLKSNEKNDDLEKECDEASCKNAAKYEKQHADEVIQLVAE